MNPAASPSSPSSPMPIHHHSTHKPQPQIQPKTYRLTLKALLSLPFRLCNPPPAVGKVRSCGVTPVFKVRLDDIIERKHLPPLGLKDFEEWLLYVELCPENLYFILWLREYTAKYRQFANNSKSRRQSIECRQHRADWRSSQLAMFYARAKQTFFTPNSQYELNLPSDLLAPFHSSDGSLFPDPSVFDQVAIETRKMLSESLERFVAAQFNNVGNNRVLCGMVAGTVCCVLGALLPIIYNLAVGNSRWLRLTALPGLWLGVALLVSSLHGVCLGVYIFGDLRQLRKFELSRPAISKPQPLDLEFDPPQFRRPVVTSMTPMIPKNTGTPERPPRPSIIIPPSSVRLPPRAYLSPPLPSRFSLSSSAGSQLTSDSCSEFSSSGSDGMIHISQAYYDHDPVEGPATATVISPVDVSTFTFPSQPLRSGFDDDTDDDEAFIPTAGFIHSYDHYSDEDKYRSPTGSLPEERQRISSFDFDALPQRPMTAPAAPTCHETHTRALSQPTSIRASIQHPHYVLNVIEPEFQPLPKGFSFTAIMRRIQARCNIKQWLVVRGEVPSGSPTDAKRLSEKYSSRRSRLSAQYPTLAFGDSPPPQSADSMRKQFRMIKAVPAFASPLTKILSPIVVRGQWEIVVRSMLIACVVAWIILGILLAVPVRR